MTHTAMTAHAAPPPTRADHTRPSEQLLVAAAGLGAIGLFARIMAYPLRHDEEMYLPVGALLSQGALYRDFGFNNLPNLPWLLHAVYTVTGTGYYLLTGRMLLFAGWLVALLAIGLAARRITGSVIAGWLCALVLLCNPVLLSTPGMLVTNNFLPLPFALAATGCFLSGLDRPVPHRPLLAAAGLLLALAAGFKANAAFLIPPFALAALLVPRTLPLPARLAAVTAPFLLGGIVGMTPVFVYLVQDPHGFLTHVLGYHRGPHIAYWLANAGLDGEKIMTLPAKLRLAARLWLWGATLPILLAVMYGIVAAWRTRRQPGRSRRPAWPIALLSGILLLSALVSFVPTPAFPQYYILPIPFAILLAAALFARLPRTGRGRAAPVLIAAAVLAILPGIPRLLLPLPGLARPADWTGARIHRAGVALARQVAVTGGTRLATLAPIYAIEGGLDVYPELTAGPLVYRVGDLIPVADRVHYRLVSPTTLGALLERTPPAAILVGFEGALDGPFVDFALDHGYTGMALPALSDRYGTGMLYLRPATAPARLAITGRRTVPPPSIAS